MSTSLTNSYRSLSGRLRSSSPSASKPPRRRTTLIIRVSILLLVISALVATVLFVCGVLPSTMGFGGGEGGGEVDVDGSASSEAAPQHQPQRPSPGNVGEVGDWSNMRGSGNSTKSDANATADQGDEDAEYTITEGDDPEFDVVRCTPIFQEVQFEIDDGNGTTTGVEELWQCVIAPDDDDDTGGGGNFSTGGNRHAGPIRTIVGLDPRWLDENADDMMGGSYDIVIPGAVVTDEEILVPTAPTPPTGDAGEKGDASNVVGAAAPPPPPSLVTRPFGFRNKTPSTMGEKVVLAVRIVDPEGVATTATEEELRESIFGVNDVNLKTQMEACSYGAINITAYDGETEKNGARITGGVVTVNIDVSVTGSKDTPIRHGAIAALEDMVGDIPSQFDHVMLCIPPGTQGKWIAYAYPNEMYNWLSVYNDRWCKSPTATMHEISHNLQIAHAGQYSSSYGDTSGTMGSSNSDPDLPRKCFNGAKSYQLGWYADRTDSIDPLVDRWDGRIVGVVDYRNEDLLEDDLVVIKLQSPSTRDYYIAFNHAVDFNSGTGHPFSIEGGNRVMVTTQGDGYSQSSLEAILSVDWNEPSYVIENYGYTGVSVVVNVTDIVTDERPGYALVSVYREDGAYPDPTPDPGEDDNGTSCDPDMLTVEITVVTDDGPQQTSWTVTDVMPGETVVASKSNYTQRNTTYVETLCLHPDGCYTFEITDSENDGICCQNGNGSYIVVVDGQEVASGGEFATDDRSARFGDFCFDDIEVTTTFAAGNGQAGNMFDMEAAVDGGVAILGFDVHTDAPFGSTVMAEVYTRNGTYRGHETNSSSWTVAMERRNVTSMGLGNATSLGYLDFPAHVAMGSTRAFYVTLVDGDGRSSTMRYTDGDKEGNVLVNSSHVVLRQGVGKAYGFGATFSPRIWNGVMTYGLLDPPPSFDGHNATGNHSSVAPPMRHSFFGSEDIWRPLGQETGFVDGEVREESRKHAQGNDTSNVAT